MDKKGGGNMAVVKHLVHASRADDIAFMEIQSQYMKKLQVIRNKQLNGEQVDISAIKISLQKSGIIDKNGNLTTLYTTGQKPKGRHK